jgi:hypothetical protein
MSIKSKLASFEAIDLVRRAIRRPPAPDDDGLPDPVIDWLARLRLLCDVPFAYLVPDHRLLPTESIRFFYLNRNWTDAAVDGALSVGAVTSKDRAQLQGLHAALRNALDRQERRVWAKDTGSAAKDGPAEVVTGFLLRSRAVSGWPGLHVRASHDGQEVRLLRMERLAPAVLLVLLDGIPDRVVVEEPRAGVQFGVDAAAPGQPAASRSIVVRDPATGQPAGIAPLTVPFRADSPGVVHVSELAKRLKATNLFGADGVGSGELAIQLLQFPYRQGFGEAAPGGIGQVFHVTLSMAVVRNSAGVR